MHAPNASRPARAALGLAACFVASSLVLAGCSRDELAPDCFLVVDGVCVVPDPGGTAVGIDCATLPPAAVGAEYSFTPNVGGGSGDYEDWQATGLPPGLSIDPVTGEISGIPEPGPEPGQEAFDFADITISVFDAGKGQAFSAECGNLVLNPRLNSLAVGLEDYRCVPYTASKEEMIAFLGGGDGTEITCRMPGAGSGTCPLGDGNGRLAPGITFDPDTCTHSGSISGNRFGTWVWMVELEQSGYETVVPFCATNDLDTFHDIRLLVNGTDDDELKPGTYGFDPDQELSFGNGIYHWDIDSPDCPGSECNTFGFRFDVVCSPFDINAPYQITLSPSGGTETGLSHEMTATGPVPAESFRWRPWVASFEMSYCTSSVAFFCDAQNVDQFEQNAQTKYHFDVVAYPTP